ncbi:acyl-CoA N-acyltransferase [Aspergillus varians]
MPIQVRPLTKADIPGAVDVIQQAFAEDPYFRWVFDEKSFNKTRNYGSLEARCLWGIENAIFHVAVDTDTDTDTEDAAESTSSAPGATDNKSPGEILGVSCWLAPHPLSQPESWYSWAQSWALWFRQGLNNIRHGGRGGLNVRRYYIWKERQAEAQKSIWDDERGYYFCNIVAVRPEAQGRGVGRKLFEEVIRVADQEGRRCYLESSRSEPNVGIYERFGFEMKKVMECQDGQDGEDKSDGDVCMLYCMVREPKSSS